MVNKWGITRLKIKLPTNYSLTNHIYRERATYRDRDREIVDISW